MVEANDAQPSTTYFFRKVQDSGTALASYINYPELTVAATPGVTITESAASTDVTEGGAQDTYDVVLDGAPSGTVTITVTPDADVSVSDTTLTFTTGNWATPQTVTVTAVNDAVVEGAHTGTITHSASGGGYDAVSINNVVANVTDNDTASVTVTESGGSTDVTEVGAQDTYDVVLDLEPSGTVTITVSPDSDVTVNTTTLTFTTGNWSTPQTVTVTAVDDAIVEGAHTGTITHSASGGSYDGVSINNVVANITDRPPTVTVTESGGTTDVTEGGTQDTYDVVLDAQPTGAVTITVSPDSDVSVNTTTLVFTTGNWSVAQTVTTTAVDDGVVEGAHTGTVTHSSSGGGYDGVSINSVVANVTDDDAASVTVTESGGSTDVTEGGAQDSYDVVLDLEPSGTVTITLSPEADVSLSTTTLTFTTGNWSTPQTVTVTAVDDGDVEGAHTGTITHSASGGAYDGVSINNVVANVTDNDAPAGVTIAESGGSTDVTEGGSNDSYDVVLDAAPSGTVTVTVTPDSEVSVSTTTLIFTTGNWSTAQTVTVNAVDDAIMELPHTGTITHDATGGGYDSVTIDDVVANVTDAGPSATITESGGSTDVAEGGANDTYDVVLDAKPTSTVTVNVSPDSELQVDKSSLTFTTTDWDTPQTVTVTAANDSDVEGLHIAPVTHTATGGGYDSASISTVFANITDDDATVTVTESGGSTDVTEGGANDTYDVVLDGLPTATVTITISPGSELSVNTTTLTFTTGNWSSPQTVTVDGVSDALVEGFHTSTITHSPSGGGYDGVTVDSVVANITDAPPTVTVTESGGTTDVTEGVANDSYDVVLDAKPTASVTITITPVSQVSADKSDLTFTTLNWSTPQTVTVTAVNDAAVEGAHTGTIDHAPSGGGYDGISVASVVANVTDDDATVTVTESAASTDVTEAGANDTYDVVLDALPTGTVTITVSPDTQVSVSTTTLTFTTSDWSTPQSVTVTAIDDATVEGAHTGTITHSASGGGYGGVTIDDVVANITDAPPTVTVTESGGSTDVAEGGANDTYDVVLDAKPTGAVSITVSPDSDVSVDQGSLTFTTLDWSTPQTVTVSAVDDSTVEGTHTGTVTHSPSGGGYDGVSIASVVANVTDDDASVTVTETGGTTDVTEGGANDTYDVVLDAAPTGSVTITVSPDSQVSTDKSSLVFTTGNWSTPQTVTVDAVDDAELEGGHIGTITHSASGGGYDGVSISNVSAFVTDNEAGDFPVVSTGDSYITEDSKSTNYGSETAMYVKSRRGNRDRRAFVQFDVSSIPAGTTVSAATLTLCATAVPGVTRTYEVHRISASWVESTINWNNQPAVEASATDTVTTPASAGCMNWNVVADVQVWVDGTANNGWRVMDQTESSQTEYQTTYRTREDTAVLSERPLLDVTYSRADITPNNLATSTPEAVVSYTHTVTNDGTDSDTFDITATSNEGWTITLFESDGVTPLSDTDADTVPDTGALLPNVSVNIVVKVTVGWSSTNETTTVTATSSNDPTASANATDATTAPPTITLTLTDPTLALGSPDPNCQGNPSGTPVGEFTVYVGSTGNQGCGYAWDGITVTVKSNAAWSGTIVGADQVPTSDITVANGSFRYDSVSAPASYSDCSADTQLPTTPAPFEPGGPTGINVYNFWHCVRLDWDDGDGTIDSTITYTVSQ